MIREKYSSALLADSFVRKTDWQKVDNMTMTHDDLYAHTRETNVGASPFDIGNPPPKKKKDDVQEYVPINTTHPPSKSQKNRKVTHERAKYRAYRP